MKRLLAKLLPFLFLIVLVALLALTTRGFIKSENIANILRFSSGIVIMGVGMTFVIVSAGIDLSVGSIVAFTSIIVAWCMHSGIALIPSLLIGTLTGSVWGLLNGQLIAGTRLPPVAAVPVVAVCVAVVVAALCAGAVPPDPEGLPHKPAWSLGLVAGGGYMLVAALLLRGLEVLGRRWGRLIAGPGLVMTVAMAVSAPGIAFAVAWLWAGVPLLGSVTTCLVAGVAGLLLNGLLMAGITLPPFVATLASMGMARGSAILLARHISGFGTSIEIPDEGFAYIGSGPSYIGIPIPALVAFVGVLIARRYADSRGDDAQQSGSGATIPEQLRSSPLVVLLALGVLLALVLSFAQLGTIRIPVPFPVVVMFLVVALGHYILNHTRLGRYTFAIGSNVEAARFSGIGVRRYTLMVYILLGTLAGLAGMIEASINRGGHGTLGQGYELQVIAAVVIGGGSLSGGLGTILGTLSGALIMGVIRNGCILNRIDYEWQLVVISVLIVIAVAADTYRRRRTGTA